MRRSRGHVAWCVCVAAAWASPCVAQEVVANGVTSVEAPAEAAAPELPGAPAADGLKAFAERMTGGAAAAEPGAARSEAETPLGVSPSESASLPAPAGGGGESWVLSTLASLGVVIGLILLLRWAWSRVGGGAVARPTPAVEVLSRTAVAARNHVLLVRVGGRILVLSDSSGGLRTLADIEDPEEVANLLGAVTSARATSAARGFMQVLSQSDREFDRVQQGRAREEGGDDGEFKIDRARESVAGLLSRVRTLAEKGAS